MNIRLITDPKKLVRAAGKATFKRSEIINADLVLVETTRPKILLNKPIGIGWILYSGNGKTCDVSFLLRVSASKIW